jgi:hypothetical protein
MLTEISTRFASEKAAKRALTNVRKRHRIALRGAVVIERRYVGEGAFYVHAPLGGTGFSAEELAAELHAYRD